MKIKMIVAQSRETLRSGVYSYMECLAKVNSGDELPVTVLRDGKEVILKVKF